jgi:hypothetical protein
MKSILRCFGILIVAVSVSIAGYGMAMAAEADYDAGRGHTPDVVCPPYELFVTGTSGSDSLEGKALVINTTVYNDYWFFRHIDQDLEIPENLVIEANMRVVSGNRNAAYRDIAVIGFTTEPNVGGALWIGPDRMFLTADNIVVGDYIDSTIDPTFDTNDTAHKYKIEVDQTGAISVFYDGAKDPILTGSVFYSAPANGPVTRVAFGDGTIHAFGVTEWLTFKHNACAPITVQ